MVGAGSLLVVQVETALLHGLDDTARAQAQATVAALAADPTMTVLPRATVGPAVVQVVDAAGRVVASSLDLQGNERLFTFAPGPAGSTPVARTVHAATEDRAFRAVAVGFGAGGRTFTVYAGMPQSEVDHTVAELVTSLVVGLPVLIVALGGVGWVLVGRALRPVEALRRQAAEITATDLHRRLALPEAHDEIHRLGSTLNDLLVRLDSATTRQRQFVADAAHELRSPLATIRTQLEVALIHPEDPNVDGLPTHRVTELLDDVDRLTLLVDDLVRLARLDASPRWHRDDLDLDELVRAEVRRARTGARVTIMADRVVPTQVVGDGESLVRVVRNLLDNSVRHARSVVRVSLGPQAGYATLLVEDDGAGIPLQERQRVFERFTRLDEARARDAGGVRPGPGDRGRRGRRARWGCRRPRPGAGSRARFRVRLPLSV